MPHIRLSSATDAPALTEIWRASVRATHDFLSPEDFREIETLVSEHYLPNAEVWVIEDDGRPVGFMGLTDNQIDSLFIAADQRGKGIGKRLIAHAQSLNGGTLTVDVNEQNAQAVGFYRHMGFIETGRSETDDQGRPYPLIHMRQQKPA
ncbi:MULTISPECIES: acetyltransferase [Brucella]|uniref:Acetyltransferase n=1 Tax=Ochrobactrum soli TaxID=2448455 RepID=A0A2P9HJF1_9HYPH|nr:MULTISPECIES: acetyltransferase [Brucella]RRD27861.1 acetyltransferase [Brucellaceae bacterium VT-16-1752]WHT41283.1 acetyltransferase [Ochrobactrum sp. SSR]MDX4075425.1 acetyltransferase [Brucella sp. NBRC 113783]WHS32229.1 acetyltransferase [Brucella sp. NM4]SPL64276.1 Acetyltransferase [[Ochrobactrum] soli]